VSEEHRLVLERAFPQIQVATIEAMEVRERLSR
jgi:hypothetical protein